MNKNPDFLHRLNGYESAEPCQLSDAIDDMTGRAFSIIALLESEFVFDREMRLSDEIIFNALKSIEMELLDIKSTVDHFYQTQNSPSK